MIDNVKKSQLGFSLVELMLAVAVGLMVTAGALQIFVSSSKTFQIQDEWARVQESARFSLDTMVRDIRQMGFSGCLYKTKFGSTGLSVEKAGGIQVLEGDSNIAPHDSDEIRLLVVDSSEFTITNIDADGITITADRKTEEDFSAGDYAVISNCQRAELVLIQKADKETLILENAIESPTEYVTSISNFSAIYPAQQIVYALDPDKDRSTLRKTANRADIAEAKKDDTVPVADGITDMKILYGQINPADGSFRYYRAGEPGLNMEEVFVIKLVLTLEPERSGNDIPIPDEYKKFETVIALRNR